MSPAEGAERRVGARHPHAIALIALMAIGSGFMWVGLPLLLVYVASQLADSSQPSLGPYILILFGLPAGMFAVGKGLAALDRRYGRITGTLYTGPVRATWLRSMRGERTSTRPRTVLDVVMIVSVGICLIAAAIWFFGFAGDPTPSGP